MSPVTEVAHMKLIEGNPYPDVEENSEQGKTWRECLDTLKNVKGVQRVHWGREIENPNNLTMFIDWESLEAHRTYEKHEEYPGLKKKIMSLFDGPPIAYHTAFTPHPPTAALRNAENPSKKLATEIISMYFPKSYSSEDMKNLDHGIVKLLADFQPVAAGCHGTAAGWTEEELPIPGSAEGSEKGKLFHGCLGWDSVDAHMQFRETQDFKDNIHILRGAKDMKSLSVVHVNFQQG